MDHLLGHLMGHLLRGHLYSIVSSGFFDQIQQKAEEEMKSITLQDVIDRYEEKTAHLGIGSF